MARSDFWFHFPLRVRFAETDTQGVVFFANYLMYCDTTHTEYLRALPYNYTERIMAQGLDFHVVNSNINYRSFAQFDDPLEIYMRTARFGRTSTTLHCEIYKTGEEGLIADADLTMVQMDTAAEKPAPWRSDFVEAICAREVIPPEMP